MRGKTTQSRMIRKLVDSLYVEAMVLTDEARAYFDEFSRSDRSQMDPVIRVSFSCESLKVTTRLMHVIAWLLAQRADDQPQKRAQFMLPIEVPMRLGSPVESEATTIARLPEAAQQIIDASIDLFARVRRLDMQLEVDIPPVSPAHLLIQRVARAF